MRRALVLAWLLAGGCGSGDSPQTTARAPADANEPKDAEPAEAAAPEAEPAADVDSPTDQSLADLEAEKSGNKSFRARLVIDEKADAEGFQGVWLEREDGDRWLISYQSRSVWKAFEGKQVVAQGGLYDPKPPARDAQHMVLITLEAVPKEGADPISIGPETSLTGKIRLAPPPDGAEGRARRLVLESGDRRYELFNRLDGLVPGKQVEIRGRELTRPAEIACAGDAWFWAGRVEEDRK